jgi:hypothetical protein
MHPLMPVLPPGPVDGRRRGQILFNAQMMAIFADGQMGALLPQ